jgi:hypothetical protein
VQDRGAHTAIGTTISGKAAGFSILTSNLSGRAKAEAVVEVRGAAAKSLSGGNPRFKSGGNEEDWIDQRRWLNPGANTGVVKSSVNRLSALLGQQGLMGQSGLIFAPCLFKSHDHLARSGFMESPIKNVSFLTSPVQSNMDLCNVQIRAQ